MSGAARLSFLGHSTVLIELDGARLLTDPVLSDRLLHLTRRSAQVDMNTLGRLDAILISHLHQDHLHPRSLRRLDRGTPLIVPAGGGGVVRRAGFDDVREVEAGDRVRIAEVEIEAVPADHRGDRTPLGPRGESLGYIAAGARRIYFAGDTGLFDGMADLGEIDTALLPVWGWGTTIGEGHLNPRAAAEALKLLKPRIAIPIHWGTFFPIGTKKRWNHRLTEPPLEFAKFAAEMAPEVEVRVLQPGGSTDVT